MFVSFMLVLCVSNLGMQSESPVCFLDVFVVVYATCSVYTMQQCVLHNGACCVLPSRAHSRYVFWHISPVPHTFHPALVAIKSQSSGSEWIVPLMPIDSTFRCFHMVSLTSSLPLSFAFESLKTNDLGSFHLAMPLFEEKERILNDK